ncbi:hypothetical protein [Amycolatopsis anabasis]|uniref:hypothetical protein n=1 Tax=Amycolatopsis anabasis TaxID=1840409 RepID=UPI00131B5C0B|nr:hypothetical protein [Amycolatopsis anabasis]
MRRTFPRSIVEEAIQRADLPPDCLRDPFRTRWHQQGWGVVMPDERLPLFGARLAQSAIQEPAGVSPDVTTLLRDARIQNMDELGIIVFFPGWDLGT